MKRFGVDISRWQGDFDMAKAKTEGVTFVIVKGGGGDSGLYVDRKFATNYDNAKRLGLPVGCYWYSKALTVAQARQEAEFFYTSCLKGRQFELPVYMDVEQKDMLALGKRALTDIIKAFLNALTAKGYFAGIYSSKSMFGDYMYDNELAGFPHWVAQWAAQCTYSGQYGMWQFGGEINKLRENKVAGVVCDQDYMLVDYPTAIKAAGMNGFTKTEVTKMTEAQLRQKVVDTILGWVGLNEADGSHKKIVDIYNSHKPLARGYALKYTDAWCAGTVSAVAIVNNITDIMPTEVGVGKMIDLYKALGRWMERDDYTPQIGDVVVYAWSDDGVGECTTGADHVGIVTKVSGTSFWVTEGNYRDSVKTRSMQVNGRYIRGFGLPDYAKKATGVASAMPTTTVTEKTVTVKLRQLKKGSVGNDVKALQTLLIVGGYSCGSAGADGDFGSGTDAAVRKYQKANGLTVDGVVGAVTWGKLLGA